MIPIQFSGLEPKWLVYIDGRVRRYTDSFQEAQGVMFLCPECFHANAGPVGTHSVEVTFAGRAVPDEWGSHGSEGKPSRWTVGEASTGAADLTLTPSIDISRCGGCAWHGYITGGFAR